MTVGIVLVSKDGFYLKEDGSLPSRPSFDKTLLLHLCKGKKLLCSTNTLRTLPGSVLSTCESVTINPASNWEVNLGISTFKASPPDTMYVVRSNKEALKGKKLRTDFLEGYTLLTEGLQGLEIWSKNNG